MGGHIPKKSNKGKMFPFPFKLIAKRCFPPDLEQVIMSYGFEPVFPI